MEVYGIIIPLSRDLRLVEDELWMSYGSGYGAVAPIVVIDNAARLGRHAAPIHG
jgi:hypothetical protein